MSGSQTASSLIGRFMSGPRRLAPVFRALRSRNFRLFCLGQGLSLVGSWMTRVAMAWLVYRLTDSAWLLGLVGFASQIPAFLLAPFAGVFADRWNRRRLLVATQVLAMLQALTLAALTLTGVINVVHVLLLCIVQGVVTGFDIPIRQSFVVHMVDRKDDLPNAIALNSMLFNGARLIGPSLAGLLIAASGEGICFLIDGLSYAAVIAALLAMRVPHVAPRQAPRPILHELGEAVQYVRRFTPIRYVLTLISISALVGMPYMVLMPIIAAEVLGGGAHTYGFLMAASGLGALAGGFVLASRKSVLGLGSILPRATLVFGLALAGLAYSRVTWLSIGIVLVAGFSIMTQMAASNTVVQTIVDDDKRGRVMSFYMMSFMGAAPIGSLMAGGIAERLGAPRALLLGGIGCLLGALWFTRRLPVLRAAIRPVYRRLGILPQIASGMQAATAPSVRDD